MLSKLIYYALAYHINCNFVKTETERGFLQTRKNQQKSHIESAPLNIIRISYTVLLSMNSIMRFLGARVELVHYTHVYCTVHCENSNSTSSVFHCASLVPVPVENDRVHRISLLFM